MDDNIADDKSEFCPTYKWLIDVFEDNVDEPFTDNWEDNVVRPLTLKRPES